MNMRYSRYRRSAMDKDPKFWEWLRNRDKPAQKEEQPRLELPMPGAYPRETEPDRTDRGVCIIEVF